MFCVCVGGGGHVSCLCQCGERNSHPPMRACGRRVNRAASPGPSLPQTSLPQSVPVTFPVSALVSAPTPAILAPIEAASLNPTQRTTTAPVGTPSAAHAARLRGRTRQPVAGAAPPASRGLTTAVTVGLPATPKQASDHASAAQLAARATESGGISGFGDAGGRGLHDHCGWFVVGYTGCC